MICAEFLWRTVHAVQKMFKELKFGCWAVFLKPIISPNFTLIKILNPNTNWVISLGFFSMFTPLKSLIGICSLLCISIFTIGISLCLLIFSPFAYFFYSKYCQLLKKFWFDCILSMASVLMPSNLSISYNIPTIESSGINIYISNHQVPMDWFYSWYLKHVIHPSSGMSIVLKSSLYKLPFVGPVIFCVSFYRQWTWSTLFFLHAHGL